MVAPVADNFYSTFDEWFTETIGQLTLWGNIILYVID